MTSVNTNAAAITALRTLQATNQSLESTQSRISTGLKIGEAKDNAAYWAISTTLKSDNKSLSTVKDALGLGSATVDVAYQGLNKAKDVLDEIKAKLTAATQPGVDRNVIQSEIGELQKQLVSIAGSSVFSGENWLSVDSSAVNYDATKKIVASFARDANNSVAIGTVDVAIGGVALYDASTVPNKNGILDGMQNLKGSDGKDLLIGGTASTSGNNVDAGLTVAGAAGKVNGQQLADATGANITAAGAAVAQTGGFGAGATPTPATATYTGGGVTLTGAAPTGGDTLTIGLTGGRSFTLALSGTAAPTATEMKTAIDAAIAGGTLTGVTATVTGGTNLVLTTTATGTGTTAIKVTSVTSSGAGTWGAGTSTDVGGTNGTATAGSMVTTGAVSPTGLAANDVVKFAYRVDGGAVQYANVTLAGGDVASASALATKLQTVSMAGVTVTNPSGTTLGFRSTTLGTTSNFSLEDVTVTSSAGVTKNSDILASFTESKAGTALTDDVQTTWATKFQATDKITLGLTVDGGTVKTSAVTAGASLSAFVANLNLDNAFSLKATASLDATNNKLVITSKTTGATSAVVVNSVSFSDSNNAPVNKTGTGFKNVATAGSATTTAFPVDGLTLDDNDNIYFNVAVDGAVSSKLVSINQALVNKTLSMPGVPVTDGKIATAAQFQQVVNAALTAAGVTNVGTSLTGAGANQLTFTSKTVGANSAVAITSVSASTGANQMSIDKIDISAAGLSALNVTSGDDISKVLKAYISVVNNAINQVTTAASNLGAVASRIDMQKSFVNTLMDTIDKGVGNLIDADMSEESTKLQALQVKQQLGVQALSIANQSSQNILSLFRG